MMLRKTLVVFLFVASALVSIPSSFAVGPGLQPFEEGKGTIGMVCTDSLGRQVAALPSFTSAISACGSHSDMEACMESVRSTSRREFGACVHGVQDQWVAEAVRTGFPVGTAERPANIWRFVDGSDQYRLEMSGLSTAVIARRADAASRRRDQR